SAHVLRGLRSDHLRTSSALSRKANTISYSCQSQFRLCLIPMTQTEGRTMDTARPGPADDAAAGEARPDRRARRRQETIDEILAIARAVMTEEGVNGLSLAEVAR